MQNRKAAGQTKTSSNKPPSKLESALDKLGLQNKRKLADGTTEDKSKKKKRLDDIMFGLGAAKGVTLEKDEPQGGVAPGQSLLKKGADSVGKIPDLNKLQDLLGRPDSPSEAKVNSCHLIQHYFVFTKFSQIFEFQLYITKSTHPHFEIHVAAKNNTRHIRIFLTFSKA